MPQLTPAIALRAQPYNEQGLLVALYSPHEGLMRCIARSARTPGGRQRYGSLLYPLACVQVQYTRARADDGLYALRDVEGQQAPTTMLNDPLRMFVALFSCDILSSLLRNHPASVEAYELAYGLAAMLNDGERSLAWAPSWFLLRLACMLGYQPSGGWSERNCHFDPENGCFSPVSYGVCRETSRAIGMLLHMDEIPSRAMPLPANRTILLRTLLRYLERHSGQPCRPKSLAVLEDVLR